MMDIIRANRANIGIYNTNIYTEGDGTGADGTMMRWLDGLQATVAPDAKGRVVCIADTMTCSVGVQWSDERATGGTSTPSAINITSQLRPTCQPRRTPSSVASRGYNSWLPWNSAYWGWPQRTAVVCRDARAPAPRNRKHA